ncbi:MAG: hypothetical protein M1161_02535 [Candidatus Thermoplasmatota archaeon]|jgi:hypothetical protein|nr:hypothetical protein [Candidatus Thermoplasmatota archaeon]
MGDINTSERRRLEKELRKMGVSLDLFDAIILNSQSSSMVAGIPVPTKTFINEIA